jgi:glutamate-1-semialdehyde 2,1-aminomutase
MNDHSSGDRRADDSRSEDLLRRASVVLPRRRRIQTEVIGRSQGSYIWTLDGHRYVDHVLSGGTILIGHADPRVNRAVSETSAKVDPTGAGLVEEEVLLAECISRLLPWAEAIDVTPTADEALSRALRIAKIVTGRQEVLWIRCRHERRAANEPPGEDKSPADQVTDWDNDDIIRHRLTQGDAAPGAVVVKPCLHVSIEASPDQDLPRLVRHLSIAAGTILIFDESLTGFGRHLGGYQSIVEVTPDLAVLGEAMGNGYGGGALVGRADMIEALSREVSGDQSLGSRPYVLAASLETLRILQEQGSEHTNRLGSALRYEMAEAIKEAGAPVSVAGFGSSWSLDWKADPAGHMTSGLFHQRMRSAGILLSPSDTANYLCVAMSDSDVEETVAAARAALRQVAP